jgi:hypothetical protein
LSSQTGRGGGFISASGGMYPSGMCRKTDLKKPGAISSALMLKMCGAGTL